jgi:low temperature requirement protein LtrA
MFSYLHMPLVTGVVLLAIGLEEMANHPTDALHGLYQIGPGAGTALFLLSLTAVRTRRGHRQRLDHLVGAALCLALIPVTGYIPAMATVGVLVAILLGVAIADRLARRTELAAAER